MPVRLHPSKPCRPLEMDRRIANFTLTLSGLFPVSLRVFLVGALELGDDIRLFVSCHLET